MTDWRRQVRRHGRSVAVGALVVVIAVTAPVMLARARSRRRSTLLSRPSTLLSRGAEFTGKARRLGQALERIADDPNRLAPASAGLGSRTAAAIAAMVAQIIATTIVRTLVKQRER